MNHQALFSSKDKSKKKKCRLLQFCLALLGLTLGLYTCRLFIEKKTLDRDILRCMDTSPSFFFRHV